jgi:hypothetical protein
LLATIAAQAKKITVEMSDVTFLCSAGLRALLQYWRPDAEQRWQPARDQPVAGSHDSSEYIRI